MKPMWEVKRPGTDINNPDHVKSAKAVIKRRRTEFEKKTRKKLSLFADHIIETEYRDNTVEEELERRERFQEENREWFKEFNKKHFKQAREMRAQVRSLCADDNEFMDVLREAMTSFGVRHDKWNRWSLALLRIKKRLSPLSDAEDLVLAWLEQEIEPVTFKDLYQRRADGMTRKEMIDALWSLFDRRLVQTSGCLDTFAWQIKNNPQPQEKTECNSDSNQL